jgi:hypothetical protein
VLSLNPPLIRRLLVFPPIYPVEAADIGGEYVVVGGGEYVVVVVGGEYVDDDEPVADE